MNDLLSLIIFILVSLGLSSLWSISEIFQRPRNFVAKYFPTIIRKALLCMECSSFWIAAGLALFVFNPVSKIIVLNAPFDQFFLISHFVTSIFCGVVIHLLVQVSNNFKLFINYFEGN